MDDKVIPKKEERLWKDMKGIDVATNNARLLGELDELIVNKRTGKIVDIVVRMGEDSNIIIKGARRKDNFLLIPFAKVEKVGDFIIVTE